MCKVCPRRWNLLPLCCQCRLLQWQVLPPPLTKRKVRAPPRALALFLRDLLLEVGAGLEESLRGKPKEWAPTLKKMMSLGRLEETPTGRASGCHSLTFFAASVTMQRK